MESVTQSLLRKEVLISRFKNFNEEPVTYNALKFDFNSNVKDLNISKFEELPLLNTQ